MSKKVIFTDHNDEVLNAYLRDVSKYKVLERSELDELIQKAQSGDERAREKVINHNLRFVITIAKQFQNRGVPLLDLISAGNEGLCYSLTKFELGKGVTFLTYAVWWIKQHIYNTIYWDSREIRLPVSQQLLVINIAKATSEFLQKHHRNPSSQELHELTEIPIEQIDYLAQFANKTVSVDDFIGDDEDNNQVCDIIPDTNYSLEDEVNRLFVIKEIKQILEKLPIREHDVICMLYGIDMPSVNTKLVSEMLGVTRERVRQLKESALSKLNKRYINKLKNLM